MELVPNDLHSFFEVPFRIYPARSPYVSPMRSDLIRLLDPEQNPLFRDGTTPACYTLLRDGRPFGRIVAHLHTESNLRYGLKRAYFGYFDCPDDQEAAARLLGAAESWARDQGCDEIVGNFNLTAMQQVGVVTEGFDGAPYTDMHYNPRHLPDLLRACGYQSWFPMATFETDLTRFDPETLLGEKQRALLASPELKWTTLRRRGFQAQMETVRTVLNDGFAENPMFVPLIGEEFSLQAKEMMWIIDERISSLVYEAGEPIGVVVTIPDLNPFLRATSSRFKLSTPFHFLRHRLRRKRAVIILYSVSRSCHGRGMAGAMLYRVTTAMKEAGYERLGTTWIGIENPASLRQMEKLGARRLHGLHLFRKDVSP